MGAPTSEQVHDFEPGIADNGLFWTIPVGNGAVQADPATGAARLRGESVKVTDFHDFFSAIGLGDATPIPSRVTYDISWTPAGPSQHVRDADFGFVGDFFPATAQIAWTAQNDHGDVVFRSDPAGQTNPAPAAVGTERNGVFFH